MDKKSQKIQDMFNSISYRYDLLNRVLSFHRDVRWRSKTIKLLNLRKGESVLDLACGTGDMMIAMQNYQPAAVITGADFSINMLKGAMSKTDLPLVCADACMLPFTDESFDVVTIVFGFRNFIDKDKAMMELYRVLKKSGRLCILEFSKPETKLFSFLYWFYFKNILPLVGKLVSKHESAYKYLPESVRDFPEEKKYLEMFCNAGFDNVKLHSYDFGICKAALSIKN